MDIKDAMYIQAILNGFWQYKTDQETYLYFIDRVAMQWNNSSYWCILLTKWLCSEIIYPTGILH